MAICVEIAVLVVFYTIKLVVIWGN